MSSANAFNWDWCQILSFGKELMMHVIIEQYCIGSLHGSAVSRDRSNILPFCNKLQKMESDCVFAVLVRFTGRYHWQISMVTIYSEMLFLQAFDDSCIMARTGFNRQL